MVNQRKVNTCSIIKYDIWGTQRGMLHCMYNMNEMRTPNTSKKQNQENN